MNKYYLYVVLCLLGCYLPLSAEQPVSQFIHGRHSIRLGWGDALLSDMNGRLISANVVPNENDNYLEQVQGMPAPEAHDYLTNYRMALDESHKIYSLGHFFLGYRFQLTPLVGLGIEADVSASTDRFCLVNGYRSIVDEHAKNQLIHLSLMPTVRFSYYRRQMVELYSSFGVGYTFSKFISAVPMEWGKGGDSDTQGIALSATLLGVNVGNEHWFAEAELGGLCTYPLFWHEATYGTIYESRLLSISVGYRF